MIVIIKQHEYLTSGAKVSTYPINFYNCSKQYKNNQQSLNDNLNSEENVQKAVGAKHWSTALRKGRLIKQHPFLNTINLLGMFLKWMFTTTDCLTLVETEMGQVKESLWQQMLTSKSLQ